MKYYDLPPYDAMANEICGIKARSDNLNQLLERRDFIMHYGAK